MESGVEPQGHTGNIGTVRVGMVCPASFKLAEAMAKITEWLS